VASSLEIVNLCGFCSKDYMKSHANDTDMWKLSDWSLFMWQILTNPHWIVLRILSWNQLLWNVMDCRNIIPSVCKVGTSIRSRKDIWFNRQV
jgi:hypothetical protein